MKTFVLVFLFSLAAISQCPGEWVKALDSAPWETLQSAVVFKGKMWVISADSASPYAQSVWSSADGTSWTRVAASVPWSSSWAWRSGYGCVVHNDKIWILGGTTGSNNVLNDVWSSADGVQWVRETSAAAWPARTGHAVVSFSGKLWVLGGFVASSGGVTNDVWSSADGKSWTLMRGAAEWRPRTSHAALTHAGKLWILGGNPNSELAASDVWSSANGVNWQQATQFGGWYLQSMPVVDHQGKLCLLGGLIGGVSGAMSNDVWTSADGAHWTKGSAKGEVWTKRASHAAVVFDDKIWVLGGHQRPGSPPKVNDVWYYLASNGVAGYGLYR